jgi:hypothetical protein
MVKVFSILLKYFQDTIRNSIELCTQCTMSVALKIQSIQGHYVVTLCCWLTTKTLKMTIHSGLRGSLESIMSM